MPNVLVISSSVLREGSASNRLLQETLDSIRATQSDLTVVERDLAADPVPHLDLDAVTAIRGEPTTDAQRTARALSDKLIAEVNAADILLIGAPMYNFGIPTTLKSWFDYILRAGVTFRYTEAGPVGLVAGKRAIVVETRGGLYSSGPGVAMDSQEPHLRGMLGFIGITDVTFVRAEKLGFGPEAREEALAAARTELEELGKAA